MTVLFFHSPQPFDVKMTVSMLLDGGVPILSVIVAYHFHHGSTHVADIILTAFVNDTARRLSINWRPFFVVSIIGLTCPMNVEDGLRWWDCCFLLEHFF